LVEGRIVSYARGSGENGAIAYVPIVNRSIIGSSASKKLVMGVTMPYYGEEVRGKRVLVDLGLITPRDLIMPFRIIVSVDGVTITREFKPQEKGLIEEGLYGKAFYDATALLSSKIASTELHRMTILYTAEKPVIFEDSGVAVEYEGIKNGWYSYNILGGALIVEPGDILEVNAQLPESRSDYKELIFKLHVPSRHADLKIEVGGKKFDAGGTHGPVVVEAPVKYRGKNVRIYFYYNKPSERFYPSKAVVSTVALLECLVPRADVRIGETRTRIEQNSRIIELTLINQGEARADSVSVLAFLSGKNIARIEIGGLEPGGEARASIKIPEWVSGSGNILVRVLWRSYGRSFHVDKTINFNF